jgi:predicted transcriptional regulator
MIRADNFFVTQGFMRSELNLKGNELMIYAIIYGFSQDGNQRFTGSSQYLADWTGATRRSVLNTLQSLVDKGLLQREEKFVNNVKFVEYWCTYTSHPMKKIHIGGEKFSQGGEKISQGGGEKFSHNKIDNIYIQDNIDNNIYISQTEKENMPIDIKRSVKHKYGEYKNVLLTDTDLEKLKTEFANDWQQRIEKLSIYKASTGKTYKNDLATIRNWARRDKEEKQQPVKKAVGEFVKGDLPF